MTAARSGDTVAGAKRRLIVPEWCGIVYHGSEKQVPYTHRAVLPAFTSARARGRLADGHVAQAKRSVATRVWLR